MLSTPGELFFLETYRFCSLHQSPDSHNFIKSAIFNDFQRYLNTTQPQAWFLSSRSQSKAWHLCRMIQLKTNIYIPTVRKFKNFSIFLVSLVNLIFRSNYRYDFSKQGAHRKFYFAEDDSIIKSFVLIHA